MPQSPYAAPRPPRRPASRPVPQLANGRRRVRVLFLVVLFVFSVFTAQLLRVQGLQADAFSREATSIRVNNTVLPATRGRIFDRDGQELATSVERRRVIADPWLVVDYARLDPETKKRSTTKVGTRGAAEDLAPLLKKSVDDLEELLTPRHTTKGQEIKYQVLARGVHPYDWRAIRALGIPGVEAEMMSSRSYPAGAPTAALLGWVAPNGRPEVDSQGNRQDEAVGRWGLEVQYNDVLTGTPGTARREISGDGRTIPQGDNRLIPAVPGRDLTLTIDRDLSWFAYNAIAAQVRKSKALSGTAVVMDRQGRLLALAQYPTFDPTDPDPSKPGTEIRNLALEDIFEPGSTAKVMSIGAALAEGAVEPTSTFTVPYTIRRGGKTLKDSHSHPTEHLTAAGIVAQSSNVGTMLIAEKLTSEKLESYFRAFGAGQTSGLDFPNESQGILAPSDKWSDSQRFTVMYGQGMAMTAIQTASVFQTIANGGVRIPPTVVAGSTGPDGQFEEASLPEGIRVLPAKTAGQMTVMLEAVVGEGGTAKNAMIPGYRVAGKTGTATRYAAGGYTASFIGFAPAENPQYIIAVTVQKPQGGYYGGTVAGPVFRQIMAYALARGEVEPSHKLPHLYPLEVGKDAPTVAWAKDWERAQEENRRNQERTDDPAQAANEAAAEDKTASARATRSATPAPTPKPSAKPSSRASARPSSAASPTSSATPRVKPAKPSGGSGNPSGGATATSTR